MEKSVCLICTTSVCVYPETISTKRKNKWQNDANAGIINKFIFALLQHCVISPRTQPNQMEWNSYEVDAVLDLMSGIKLFSSANNLLKQDNIRVKIYGSKMCYIFQEEFIYSSIRACNIHGFWL